ncbi:glutamate receptor ionotropic, kainate 2-like [Panulirus ornatus]|uniref:glutamate receptor ionotropic, kainate 2-like n=1 Tax=Panulirus ornatus TaxID=150431 RepID=UPI003A87B4A7
MLLYAFYTCFIISHLAIKPCGRPFDTMQEMIDQQGHKYRLGFVKGISVEESFKLASSGLYQDVWKQLVEPHYNSLVRTDEQGINRALQDPRYVHFMAENKFLFQYAHNCDLVKIPHRYMEIASTFAVPKGSPLRRIFTYHMMRLRDTGIIHRHWRRWRPRDSGCDTVDSLQAFTLYNLLTVFLMLGTLAGLAMVMLGCERVAAMWKRTSLVTTVETNTSWTRLHHQLTRMTLHVFKVQTTVTTTLVRALNQQETPSPTTNDNDDKYAAGKTSSEPEGVTALVDREHYSPN